jgi:two-component system NtrC family sensor kinase
LKCEIDYDNTLADLLSIICDCREGAVRIRDVVDNLRVFSRLDEAEFKKVDIHEGIESTIRLLSRYYGAGSVTLKRDYGELPLVTCYAGQLNQVWMNLLVNAAQAVGDAGEVRVTTGRESDSVIVTISDTGCGIDPEHHSKIFDPFFTTKPVGEGTGLGLSVTYGIIERHKGTIRSRAASGMGRPSPSRSRSKPGGARPGNNCRDAGNLSPPLTNGDPSDMLHKIMVVDDEPANYAFWKDSSDVIIKSSPPLRAMKRWKLLSQHDVSVLVSDQRMPGMTGIELLKRSAEFRPHMVRIILTGYTDVGALVEAINCGHVYKYVTKPWSNDDLRLTVERALQHHETNKSRSELEQGNLRLKVRLQESKHGIVRMIADALEARDEHQCGQRGG